jgi:hypothetical protein
VVRCAQLFENVGMMLKTLEALVALLVITAIVALLAQLVLSFFPVL